MSDLGLPVELTPAQLAWRRAQKRDLRDLFEQEFAEDEVKCFLGSGNCPFSATAIQAILSDLTPIIERYGAGGETENGLWRWLNPQPEFWYVIFCDPAGGLHLSRTGLEIICGNTGEQAAEWVGRAHPQAVGEIITVEARRYNGALVAVETKLGDIAATIVAALRVNGVALYEYEPGKQGWNTNAATRPAMLDTLGKMLSEAPQLFHSSRLANELKNCERAGDRIQPQRGATDDLVMAMAGAQAVRLKRSIVPHQPWAEALEVRRDTRDATWTRIA